MHPRDTRLDPDLNTLTTHRARIDEILTSLRTLDAALLPSADVVADQIPTIVTELAAWFQTRHVDALVRVVAAAKDATTVAGNLAELPRLEQLASFPALCFADPDRATAILEGLVTTATYTAVADRTAHDQQVAALQAELAALYVTETRLVNELRTRSIDVHHRP